MTLVPMYRSRSLGTNSLEFSVCRQRPQNSILAYKVHEQFAKLSACRDFTLQFPGNANDAPQLLLQGSNLNTSDLTFWGCHLVHTHELPSTCQLTRA